MPQGQYPALHQPKLQGTHLGILNAHNDAGSQVQLLPGLAQVNDIDAIQAALVHVALHLVVTVACAQMA